MVNTKLFLIALALCTAQLRAGAQNIDSTLKSYGQQFKQERLYFHFDKSAYFPGDTVWFKTYITSGWDTSGISKNLYTDWSDASGKTLLHGIQPIVLSSSYGQMVIPGDYAGNIFHLHAYTGWMLNFDSAFLYDKDIMVIQKKAQVPANIPRHAVRVNLFPEGGYIVQSLMSTVAFKAENQYGRPVDITGALINSKGNVLDSIACLHDGMGKFFLTPEAGEFYAITWKDNEGDTGIAPLPTALPTGVTLKVSPSKMKVSYHIERAEDAPAAFTTLHLVATTWQQEVYSAIINLTQAAAATNFIPSSQLPTGILTVTLFDANWKPVSERIVFVNNNDYSFATGITAKGNLDKRGRNEIEIDVPDSIQGNLSMAVTDAGLLSDNSENIISGLLLKSEIKGYVNNPAYYFSSLADSVKDALDLVMLTNGWRRYRWEDIIAGKQPAIKFAKDTGYINLTGRVSIRGNKPIPPDALISINMRASLPADSISVLLFTGLEGDGSFRVNPGPFHDSLNIYYRLQSNRRTEYRASVAFKTNLLESVPPYSRVKPFYTPEEDSLAILQNLALRAKQDELIKLLQSTTLKGVTVKTRAKSALQVLDERYASPVFQGIGSAYAFDVMHDENAKGLYNLGTYLSGKIPGLNISYAGVPPEAIYTYRSFGTTGGGVTLYLDEMAVSPDILNDVELSRVAYIKFYQAGGLVLSDGRPSLAVYTRTGFDDSTSDVKHKVVLGYTEAKDFYSPVYPDGAVAGQGADVRSTLYWCPYILTNAGRHRIKFVFFNNDISKRLRIIIEGMSSNGKFTRAEKVIE